MFRNYLILFLFFTLFSTNGAVAQYPYMANCSVSQPGLGGETPFIINFPNGQGHAFSNALIMGTGIHVDATIEVTIRDINNNPIPFIPSEDIWINSPEGEMNICPGGSWSEQETNSQGMTYFSSPLRAGGFNEGIIGIYVNGNLVTGEGTPLFFPMNSPDINGDNYVNLADVGRFTQIFFTSYDFSADFFPDGVINLADIPTMARGSGSCEPWSPK